MNAIASRGTMYDAQNIAELRGVAESGDAYGPAKKHAISKTSAAMYRDFHSGVDADWLSVFVV